MNLENSGISVGAVMRSGLPDFCLHLCGQNLATWSYLPEQVSAGPSRTESMWAASQTLPCNIIVLVDSYLFCNKRSGTQNTHWCHWRDTCMILSCMKVTPRKVMKFILLYHFICFSFENLNYVLFIWETEKEGTAICRFMPQVHTSAGVWLGPAPGNRSQSRSPM